MREFEELLELGEQRARCIVASIAPPSTLQAFDRHCATRHAQKLLREGLEVRATAFKVASRYDVSLKSAYRRIDDALSLGPIGTSTGRR